MALSSMTGFARGQGVCGAYAWAWELKSVNAKGLDLRLRLPPGWDAVEVPARSRAAEVLARGTIYGTLTAKREGVAPVVRVNEPVLAAVLATIKSLAGRIETAPPQIDGILSLKGVIEVVDEDEREEDRQAAEAAVVAGFHATLAELADMRRREGATLGSDSLATPCRKSQRWRRVPKSCPGGNRRRSRRGSPSRSKRCSAHPSASIPTGCIRKRS